MPSSELTIRGTVRYAGDVAFGQVFELTATEASHPVGAGETVLVTVLVEHGQWAETLLTHPEPEPVEADFTLRAEHEEYATASFSGFVDASMTSWDLRDVRPTGGSPED